MTHKISDLAMDTPIYRLHMLDEFALTLGELFEIVIGGKNAKELSDKLLKYFDNDIFMIQRASIEDFMSIPGVGLATAARLKAIPAVARRFALGTKKERPVINSPADAAALVQYEMSILEKEELRVIILDTRNNVMKIETVYKGSVNSSQVRTGEIFKVAVKLNSSGIIVVHNHPSGDPTPSPDDVAVTRAFVQAGKLLDVEILDHLVIGQGKWVSLKERGLGFS